MEKLHPHSSLACSPALLACLACLPLLGACEDRGVVGGNSDAFNPARADTSIVITLLDGGIAQPPVDAATPYDSAGLGDDVPQVALCGDGILQTGEACDDGNPVPGDGCSGVCTLEPGYICETPGAPCTALVTQVCGNGLIEGSEACDDGNP